MRRLWLHARRISALATLPLVASGVAACDEPRAAESRRMILEQHAPRVAEIVVEDLERHREGLKKAADRIAPGFVKVEGEQQEREMRKVLQLIRSPKKGVRELVISPMSFMAVVGMDGIAIARDAEPDHMKGMNLAKLFPSVADALAGKMGYEIGEFESLEKGGKPSVSIVMAAPARYRGEVVGALVLGIPLWRLQQRLTKQLQMEAVGGDKKGVVVWAYIYRGDELHKHGTPADLDQLVPDADARRAGLQKSPGGFTGEVAQYGYWYGYGVRPLRVLGDDIGVILFRMDPQ